MLRLMPFIILALCSTPLIADEPKPVFPGQTEKGFLLPNGWTISPAGKQVVLTDLPLNIIPLPDKKHALVGTAGFNSHQLYVVDLQTGEIAEKASVIQSWFGLAVAKEQDQIWWAGGGADIVHSFHLNPKSLALKHTGPKEFDPRKLTKEEKEKLKGFKSGLCLSPDGKTLYSLDINRGTISAIDHETKKVETAAAGKRPYDVVVGKGGHMLYVSDWSERMVLGIDVETLRVIAKIPVGEHPNQIAVHPKDNRLFVACASSNCVSVIDTKRGIVTETIFTGLFPKAPEGSTPDAVAVSPDGKTLYVANADNNCVAVIDIEKENESQVRGFIPTGWYPTAVAVTLDSKNLLVGVGKGNQTRPNPNFKKEEKKADEKDEPKKTTTPARKFPYIGTTLEGALSIVPIPDEKALKEYTATVYRNCPYSDKLLTAAPHSEKTAIPTKVGDPSPIKHIIYVIKENRTYDQVFGAMKEGNGDPSLVMFGEKVTPNHHKLAREFVLLDNLYCNGQVSRDGHPWSTMAYNTDYIARDWHLTYSSRKGVDDTEEGALSNAPSGYIWDACARAKLTYRAYGEYGKRVSQPDGSAKMEGRVPGLVGHMCPDYGVHPLDRPEHTASLRRQQRPRPRPPGRSGQPKQILEGDRHLRDRRRRPERPRPRRCPPHRRPRHLALYEAQVRRFEPVQHRQHDPHDGTDPRPLAPEPIRRGGPADVQQFHR